MEINIDIFKQWYNNRPTELEQLCVEFTNTVEEDVNQINTISKCFLFNNETGNIILDISTIEQYYSDYSSSLS